MWQVKTSIKEVIGEAMFPTVVQFIGEQQASAAHQLCGPIMRDVEQTVGEHLLCGRNKMKVDGGTNKLQTLANFFVDKMYQVLLV